jgi:hypothetical protein
VRLFVAETPGSWTELTDGDQRSVRVAGLAGLIFDIDRADVADGVTLIPASPRQDLRTLGRDVLHRLTWAGQPRAS